MSEVQFKFSGVQGVIALVVVAALVVVRLMTLGESTDDSLHAAVRAELSNKLGASVGRSIDEIDVTGPDEVARMIENSDAESIEIHSLRVSSPLLSFSSNQRTIVYVKYRLPEQAARSEYWRFKHGLGGGWQYLASSSSSAYYLNFF